jgi:hypothetical protein
VGLAAASHHTRTPVGQTEQIVAAVWDSLRQPCVGVVRAFLGSPLSLAAVFAFEIALLSFVRGFGRGLLERTLNALEPDLAELLPHDVWFEGGGYRRRTAKTRHAHVATLFGAVCLWRRGDRSWQASERAIFPLEMCLGLTAGVAPGLVDWLGRAMAESGASQARVLERLRHECGVALGVKRLRACLEPLSQAMSGLRQVHQVDVLLEALETARASQRNRQPVLAGAAAAIGVGVRLREPRERLLPDDAAGGGILGRGSGCTGSAWWTTTTSGSAGVLKGVPLRATPDALHARSRLRVASPPAGQRSDRSRLQNDFVRWCVRRNAPAGNKNVWGVLMSWHSPSCGGVPPMLRSRNRVRTGVRYPSLNDRWEVGGKTRVSGTVSGATFVFSGTFVFSCHLCLPSKRTSANWKGP